jgi:transcriptional regulator with XRE-family HTH domain
MPDSTAPGSTAPGSTAPGSTAPGSTAPGSTAPDSTAPGSTAPDSTAAQRTEVTYAATLPRRVLGIQLRRLREERGISARDAALAIRASESKISRIELGRNAVREVDVADLLSLYDVTDQAERDRLLTLANQANQESWWHHYNDVIPAWFQPYLGMEDSAESIRSFDTQFVPGLLQTGDYAAAVIGLGARPPAATARLVRLRAERQRPLAAGNLRLHAVFDEAVLHRPVGDAKLMRAQLEHLLDMAARPQVTIQVAPLATGASSAAVCGFTILRFAAEQLPDIVYVEQLTTALYLDKRPDVDSYTAVMDQLVAASATPLQTTVMLREMLASQRG